MIRGALGSRYGISPLGRGVIRASTGYTTWWTLDGDITSCVAAYQPKGAADYATSLVNLANPGTNNAAEGVAPDWDATNGWKHNGSNDYLLTGLTPAGDRTWTAIFRFSNVTSGTGKWLFGSYPSGSGMYYGFQPNNDGSNIEVYYGSTAGTHKVSTTMSSGIYAIAGGTAYRNGSVDLATIGGTNYAGNYPNVVIGATRSSTGSVVNYIAAYIQAAAFYNSALSEPQIALLTTAMNAL